MIRIKPSRGTAEKMILSARIKPSSRGSMEKMLLGVYLDKHELEYLLNP